jgi:HSP20 family molecular chaperone IbpA
MASPKTALSGSSKAPQIVSEDQNTAFQDKVRQRVAERAYDIYQNSGGQPGNDYEHWIQAENEVLRRGIEVRESGSWLAFNASIPENSADNVEVCLTPTSVTIRAEKEEQIKDANEQGLNQREIFLTHDLNAEIEPSTASATLKDQKLTIMVKKRYPVSTSANANVATSPSTSSVAESLSKKESAKA